MSSVKQGLGALCVAVAVLVLSFHMLPSNAAQPANGTPDCRAEQALTYLCGLVLPEDVVNVGSTGLVLASGHRAPGHLYLIDPATSKVDELIQVPAFRQRHDKSAYPSCPGPLNLAAFDTHGLSIAETSPRNFVIYSTSHGEREAIEIYELDLRGAAPALTWTGCVPLQQDGYFNAVARLPDGGFVVTRMRDTNVPTNAVAPGAISGRLFEWHPGGQLTLMAGTELSLPNGIETSKDGRHVFVAVTGTKELLRLDRSVTPMARRAVTLPFGPDNVHLQANGKLIIAGPNPPGPATCNGAPCPMGWTVVEMDPDTLAFSRVGGADGSVVMQRASAAIRVGNEIWVGSNQDRIARFTPK
ncbi:MAG: hypothetical protein RLZZ403_1351 [Pseudomonadota bacterium]